ncbi:MAG: FixH family protein [Panacibacter sp.]
MNWGNKLLLVFIVFGALIGTLVYKCMQQNFELVSKDYYGDELRYQDKIDGVANANKLSTVRVTEDIADISIQLPKELNGMPLTGEAWFYCANNASNDRRIPLTVDNNGAMFIEKNKLAKTKYLLKLNWQSGEEIFYNEQSIELK